MSMLPVWLDGERIDSSDVLIERLELREIAKAMEVIGPKLKMKPLIGGAFSGGRWCLASTHFTENGLDRVHYFVVDGVSRFMIGQGSTKACALQGARAMLSKQVGRELIPMFILQLHAERIAREAEVRRVNREEQAEMEARRRARIKTVGSLPKRRRAIFEKSGGKCHYCACELTLEGRWHVEHMIPRALGGQSVEDNLVAACAPCNHKKRDQTDHEFIARREVAK